MDESALSMYEIEFLRSIIKNARLNDTPLKDIDDKIENNKNILLEKPIEKKISNKCCVCKKKLMLGATFECGCDKHNRYCSTHRFPEEHACTKPKEAIKLVKVVADKLERI
jgi:hypothetical protein